MEEQGDLRRGGDVTEGSAGLPPRRPVALTPAPCFRAPWRQRAAYRWMQVSCGGQGTAWALPGRARTPGSRENPGKIPSPGPRGSSGLPRLLPWGMVLLTGALVSRRGMPFADTKYRRTGMPSRRGGLVSGGPRSQRSQSLLAELRPDFREWQSPGPSLPPGGLGGAV